MKGLSRPERGGALFISPLRPIALGEGEVIVWLIQLYHAS
jgi:hypothetical protein